MEIAKTITQQIGAQAFAMMGASNLVASSNALTFKLGGGAKGKHGRVTHVRVTLDAGLDLYKVESIRVNTRAAEMCKTLETVDGVYFDQLRATIEGLTGFYLSL